ncbi:DUF2017 family protein [Microbacterium oxydans]|uniref:DUF2017 family protein n=1 Tax=Microbacterium oxydans TaxID=82380 RepID=UPI00226B2A6D|nr:DUF2017 family protein [Microbacterium oxydans]WAA67823.1 DUF2017 domain-containing protein [Microbacterium oxydans]
MSTELIVMPITVIEEFHLAQLVDDFVELVDGSRDDGDPALERLTPSPYPYDADAAAGFADTTRDDLLDRRLVDARRVRASLDEFRSGIDALSEGEALRTHDVLVPTDSIDAWLRTLTAIRLVIATRLGITSDDETGTDGRHDVYDWLGYRLELLIQAADELDAG